MPRYIQDLINRATQATTALVEISTSLKIIALCMSKDDEREEILNLLEKFKK